MARLSKSKRNFAYEALAASLLAVSECEFRDEEGLFKIVHPASESEFDIYVDNGGAFRVWSGVGDEDAPEGEWNVEFIPKYCERKQGFRHKKP